MDNIPVEMESLLKIALGWYLYVCRPIVKRLSPLVMVLLRLPAFLCAEMTAFAGRNRKKKMVVFHPESLTKQHRRGSLHPVEEGGSRLLRQRL